MVKDFNINDLTDQLVQNPLNLPSDQAEAKYHRLHRTNTDSFTYDPTPDPNGTEYSFQIGSINADSIRFINDITTEFGKRITNLSVFIIAHTDNPENHFTTELHDAYNIILNNLDLESLEIIYQEENKKILSGWWRNKFGVDYLDVGALYTKIQTHMANKLSDLYDQQAIIEIKTNGRVGLI